VSKIDDLIAELCPEGVRFRRLGDLAIIGTGNSDKVHATEQGEFPLIVRSKSILRTDKFEFDETAIVIPGEGGVGDIFHFVEGKYALHQRAYRICVHASDIESKFLYYFLVHHFKKHIMRLVVSGTVASIRRPMVQSFEVPLPPLQVQREIVSILDKFTLLEAELEAELEARRVQYETTRDRLLDFDSNLEDHPLAEKIEEFCPEGVPAMRVDSLCTTYRPKTSVPRAEYLEQGEIPVVDQSQNFIAGFTNDVQSKNSLGQCVVFGDHTRERKFIDFDFAAGADGTVILVPEDSVDPKFLYFTMASLSIANRGYNRHWTMVRELTVSLPPLPIQQEIVSILDKLDALVNDISIGLPAEIAARRKQYEYYSNKLLTFRELESA